MPNSGSQRRRTFLVDHLFGRFRRYFVTRLGTFRFVVGTAFGATVEAIGEGSKRVIESESVGFEFVNGRGIIGLFPFSFSNAGLLFTRIIVFLSFPEYFQKLAGSLPQKLGFLVSPLAIGIDDALHHLLLSTVEDDNVRIG